MDLGRFGTGSCLSGSTANAKLLWVNRHGATVENDNVTLGGEDVVKRTIFPGNGVNIDRSIVRSASQDIYANALVRNRTADFTKVDVRSGVPIGCIRNGK